MEESQDAVGIANSKRARDECEVESPASKRATHDSDRVDSAESRRFRDDLLVMLDEVDDTVEERGPAIQDLDSVIRSFEEEILVPQPPPPPAAAYPAPEFGFLLEASDDALGLPPSYSGGSAQNNEKVDFPGICYDDSFAFGNEAVPSYGYGTVGDSDSSNDNNNNSSSSYYDNSRGENPEYVSLGGLFDNSDLGFDVSEFPALPETLPAL